MNIYDHEIEEPAHSPEVEALCERLRPQITSGHLIMLRAPSRSESEYFNRRRSDREWSLDTLFNTPGWEEYDV